MATVEDMLKEIKTVNDSLDLWESDRPVLERMITQKNEALKASEGADDYTVGYAVYALYNVGGSE